MTYLAILGSLTDPRPMELLGMAPKSGLELGSNNISGYLRIWGQSHVAFRHGSRDWSACLLCLALETCLVT